MNADPTWQAEVRRWLRQLENAVLLKTGDPIGTLLAGGDLDILVGDPVAAEYSLLRELGLPLFRARYGYFYEWGHIDLIPRIEWRGAPLLHPQPTLAAGRMTTDGLRVADPASNAVLFWLRPILWGHFFKSGCEPLIERALSEDPAGFRSLLTRNLGTVQGEQLFTLASEGRYAKAADRSGALRQALWLRAFRQHPFRTLARLCGHVSTELRLRIRPPLPWIAVLGPDGSGKSTVLRDVCELLRATIPRRRIFHWRPAVIKPTNPEAGPVTDPHGKAPRSLPASLAKLLFLFADWWLGYWIRLAPDAARLTLCLFDRCYIDLLVDPRRYRYGGPMGLARWVGRLLPQPSMIFLLDAPAAVLQARKREVSFEETQRQASEYRRLVGELPNGVILDCDRPAPEVAKDVCAQVVRLLRVRQHGREKGCSPSIPASEETVK